VIEKFVKENLTEANESFKKWVGYFATGLIALIVFGIVGWIVLVTTGYLYLEHLKHAAAVM